MNKEEDEGLKMSPNISLRPPHAHRRTYYTCAKTQAYIHMKLERKKKMLLVVLPSVLEILGAVGSPSVYVLFLLVN